MLLLVIYSCFDCELVRGRFSGCIQEISWFIGWLLCVCIDLVVLGENMIVIDCDVLQVDGGI